MVSELSKRLLAIYLNDHLAAATGGSQLAGRSAASNRGTRLGEALERVSAEIEQDRATLLRIMDALGVSRDPAKVAAGWTAEKLGRLKLNGRLTGYSPLSRLIELEGLLLGITGKLELWRSLSELGDRRLQRFDFDDLIKRADRQRRRISSQHKAAAAEAFAGESG